MAYIINKTDGTVLTTVQDGQLDATTNLQLIGRNYISYGETFNENLIKLLENSASTTAPSKPLTGELWYDKGSSSLKVYNGSAFVETNVRSSASAPTVGLTSGTLWNDTTNDQLYMYDGSAFDLIGPIYKTSDGVSGWQVDVENLSGGGTTNVLGLYQDGTRVAILTTAQITLDAVPTGFDSATFGKGLTFYTDTDSTTFRLHGTTQNSEELGGRSASSYLQNDVNETLNGSLSIVSDTGIILGDNSDASIKITLNDLIIQNDNENQSIKLNINQGSVVTTAFEVESDADISIKQNLSINGNIEAPVLKSYTTSERSGLSAVNGMLIYNSTRNKIQGYQNGNWIDLEDGTIA